MPAESSPPDPSLVLDLIEAFRGSKIMFAAIALGVFDRLAASSAPLATIAGDLKANPDALERLLDACVGLGLLTKDEDQYANTPAARVYLSRQSPRRLTGYINYSNICVLSCQFCAFAAKKRDAHAFEHSAGEIIQAVADALPPLGAIYVYLLGSAGVPEPAAVRTVVPSVSV